MSPDLLIAAMVLGSANPMKRLLSSLVMTGLVVAAATTSAFVVAQVAPPAAEKTKTAKPVAGADLPKQVVAKAKGVAKNKGEAKQAETVKLKEAAVKQAIVARKARVAAKVANGNANLNPMIQQFTQQGRPMMRSEVLLANSLFHLTKDQLRGLVKGAEAALEKVAKEMAEYQQGGMPRVAVRGQASRNPDWAKKLQDTIAVEIKKQLKPEQFARYQSEVDARSAERKQAGLRFMVDAIDRELLLSPKQRDQLRTTLDHNWDGSWSMYLEYILFGNRVCPQEIDRLVTPVLDKTQIKVWQGSQKVSGFWGFGGIWGFQNGADPFQELLGEEQQKPVDKAGIPPPL